MSSDEATLHADAKGDLAFFINGSLLSLISGMVLVANEIAYQPREWYLVWLYLVPFVFSACCYEAAVGAAIRWGAWTSIDARSTRS